MLWPHLSESDYRVPLLEFHTSVVPGLGEGTYGFYWVSVIFWLEMLAVR
jgi:hypothetical protein